MVVISLYLVGLLGFGVVGGHPQHLLEVRECRVLVVLVVAAQAAHVNGVRVHRVTQQDVAAGKNILRLFNMYLLFFYFTIYLVFIYYLFILKFIYSLLFHMLNNKVLNNKL